MAEGQNECKMTPLDEIWHDESAALIFNSQFLPTFLKGENNGVLNIKKQQQQKIGSDIYKFQLVYLEYNLLEGSTNL